MKVIYFYFFLTLFCNTLRAQTANEEAIARFQLAQQAHDDGDYVNALKELDRCTEKIGSPNAKICYLYAMIYRDGIKSKVLPGNYSNYQYDSAWVKEFFSVVDKTTYPQEKYEEILALKLSLVEKMDSLRSQKAYYQNLQAREPRFITDTFNVMMKAFVADFNNGDDRNVINNDSSSRIAGKNKYRGGGGLYLTYRLRYDEINHSLTLFSDNKKDPLGPTINVLGKINFLSVKLPLYTADYILFGPDKTRLYYSAAYDEEGSRDLMDKDQPTALVTRKSHYNRSIVKLKELISVLDSTGFSNYFANNAFQDLK